MARIPAVGCCAAWVVFFSAPQLSAAQPWYACQKAGVVAASSHDFPKARKLFHAALQEAELVADHEQAAQSILGLTGVLVHEGDYAGAHRLLTQAIKLCDLDSQISARTKAALHATLSHAHEGLGNLEEAAREASVGLARLERQSHVDEEIVDLLSHLAGVKVAAGDHPAAEAIAAHAVAMAEDSHAVSRESHASACAALAAAQHAQGSHDAAIATADKAKAMVPTDAHAVHAELKTTLGLAHAAQGRHGEASTYLQEASEHHGAILPVDHPEIRESLERLRHVLMESGRTSEAEAIADRIGHNQAAAGKPSLSESGER